jgi:hypothetical protein
MARISCGASLITGPKADDATYHQVAVVPVAPSFYLRDSARFYLASIEHAGGVTPQIRDIYASDRRLAGAGPDIDLPGGRESDIGHGLLSVQTYGG